MKAIVHRRYGPPETLSLEDVPVPELKDDEVLIRVEATSVNSWDWDIVVGTPLARMLNPLRPAQKILGCDIAGRVEAKGAKADDFEIGDEVFGDISDAGWGGFAELVAVRQEVLARKPSGISFVDAAALPQAGVLALQGLRHRELQPGERVLLNGAGGGVGTLALQIAKALGAHVTVVDRQDKLSALLELGADAAIDYASVDPTLPSEPYDLILDVVGRRSMFAWSRALARRGVYGMIGGSISRLAQVALVMSWGSRLVGKKMGLVIHRPNRADLEQLVTMVEAGELRVIVDETFPLPATATAVQRLGEANVLGKVVVEVREPHTSSGSS